MMYPHPYPLHILILNILDILQKRIIVCFLLGSHSFKSHQPFSNTVCFVRVLKMEEPYGHVPMSHTTLIGRKVKGIILSLHNSQFMST